MWQRTLTSAWNLFQEPLNLRSYSRKTSRSPIGPTLFSNVSNGSLGVQIRGGGTLSPPKLHLHFSSDPEASYKR